VTTVLESPAEAAKPKKPSTAAFKAVPDSREMRDRVRDATRAYCARLDRSQPLTKDATRDAAESILRQLDLGEQFLGFTMVMVSNEFWRDQIASIPFHRRLLLVPHCLKNAEGCPADYDEFGLDCRKCGACSVADFKTKAEDLGYKVLVSEGTPIVLKIIVSGHVDAIVGVACLNVLEKAFDKILLAGIPCIATPLLSSNCKNTSVDGDWVFDMIGLQISTAAAPTKSYVHLMRAANAIFEEPELTRLAPRPRQSPAGGTDLLKDPLLRHEALAYDFLAHGGKRSRPFITLAAYDALTGGKGRESEAGVNLSDGVKHAAVAIETFHKASLVHDDIEDDDAYRYGRETLHRTHGTGVAINVGDYLIGLGYRLVSRDRKEIGAEVAADILDKLADAHLKLSEGQGAELLWRDAENKVLTPTDALKIYALKTSPAFEAALYAGARLAGPTVAYDKPIADFARNIGVAFQILNDFKDWTGDEDNKLMAGQDVLAARPTLLLALALEAASPADKADLLKLLHKSGSVSEERVERVRGIYHRAKVFARADGLVDKFRAKAEAIADEIEPAEFRELLYYLVDTVLEKTALPEEPVTTTFQVELGLPARAAG
jgi:geranylgeranyl pyrophosphate synthase